MTLEIKDTCPKKATKKKKSKYYPKIRVSII